MRTAIVWRLRPGWWRADAEEDRRDILDQRIFPTHAEALAWAIEQVEEKEANR